MNLQLILIVLVLVIGCMSQEKEKTDPKKQKWSIVGSPLAFFHLCKGNDDVTASWESGQDPEEENKYQLYINVAVIKYSRVDITFDTEAKVTLLDSSTARVTVNGKNSFRLNFYKEAKTIPTIEVKGTRFGVVPYMTNLKINNVEYCEQPNIGVLDPYLEGYKNTAETSLSVPDDTCGRRKVEHTELITQGLDTKPGDWPWHVALYKLERSNIKYICGGTLISNNFVLTAAHCTTVRGKVLLPEILSVVLGKYNLIGGDTAAEEREVHQIIVHENYNHTVLDNDIALLKLKTVVVFNDYIQPACIWYNDVYKKLPSDKVQGTVVGWGFDQTDNLSSQLRQANMPMVNDGTCIKSNPLFFSRMLNGRKFCAGQGNGTSACNGDSGGGFVVFVPDVSRDPSPNATGTWHIRGIVSVGVSRKDIALCDPFQYVLFTDVLKFSDWINGHIK